MIHSIDEIKIKIKPIAAKYNLPRVYIFGSYARGEASENSDLDVLVDISGSDVVGMSFFELDSDLSETFGKVDVVTIDSLSQYAESDSEIRFNNHVLDERVLVYEKQ
jgi:predicted nucleotidyltransferase